MLQEQGIDVEGLHCSFEPITDERSVEKAKDLARELGLKRLHIAKIGHVLADIPKDRDAHKFYFVMQKRLFYRLADKLADDVGADAIATGENLGQVSSQTLRNLRTIESAARRPVVRPLLGLDKVDIIDHAKQFGTFETSVGPELCDLLGPAKPATTSTVEQLVLHEGNVGLDGDLPAIETAQL